MKFFILLVAVASAAADVSHLESQAPVVRSDYQIAPEGNFNYVYETGNGIAAQAQGVVKNPANENPAIEIQGAYKYTAPDGSPVEITYVANELGFQPSGALLPTPPPIPEAIARSLQYIASHPPSEYVASPTPLPIKKPAVYPPLRG